MKKGVLIVNLGTPAAPTAAEVKVYLKRFLSDKRVIKTPDIIWQPILRGIILNTRPKKSAALYQKIWTEHGSPLLISALEQQKHLQKLLPEHIIKIGMSYSHPLISESLEAFTEEGVTDLTIIPMYPQYSGTTVGSVYDDVQRYFYKSDRIVNLRFIHSFYEIEGYSDYFANKINEALLKKDYDAILMSYHGIPKAYAEKGGDPYPLQCQLSTEKITSKLKQDISVFQTYQSKFGPGEWLTPATDQTMKDLPRKGIKKILVVTPGFVADCLETIEEILIENKTYFMESGGEVFDYLSPFNEDPELAAIFKEIVVK